MSGSKSITSKENAITCNHNHFFNPTCERNSIFKKIITIAFYAFTFLWIPLVAYRIYETKCKKAPKLESQQQPPVTFQSQAINSAKKDNAQRNSEQQSRGSQNQHQEQQQQKSTPTNITKNQLQSPKKIALYSWAECLAKALQDPEKNLKNTCPAIKKFKMSLERRNENVLSCSGNSLEQSFRAGVCSNVFILDDLIKVLDLARHEVKIIVEGMDENSKTIATEEFRIAKGKFRLEPYLETPAEKQEDTLAPRLAPVSLKVTPYLETPAEKQEDTLAPKLAPVSLKVTPSEVEKVQKLIDEDKGNPVEAEELFSELECLEPKQIEKLDFRKKDKYFIRGLFCHNKKGSKLFKHVSVAQVQHFIDENRLGCDDLADLLEPKQVEVLDFTKKDKEFIGPFFCLTEQGKELFQHVPKEQVDELQRLGKLTESDILSLRS